MVLRHLCDLYDLADPKHIQQESLAVILHLKPMSARQSVLCQILAVYLSTETHKKFKIDRNVFM